MSKRKSKDQYFLEMARLVASRGTCARRQVGCVIVNKYGHVKATGYNGVPKGATHCIDKPCDAATAASGTRLEECGAIHAEQNALLQCSDVMAIDTIYLTVAPCIVCARLISNTSVKRVVYSEYYPGHENALELLRSLGIACQSQAYKASAAETPGIFIC